MVERLLCTQEVRSSTLLVSTKFEAKQSNALSENLSKKLCFAQASKEKMVIELSKYKVY